MIRVFLTITIFLFTFGQKAGCQKYFDFNDQIKAAYLDASSLRIDKASESLAKLKIKEPDNVLIDYIENYLDFFTLFIKEDHKLYKTLIRNKQIRLNAIKKGDQRSPYYLYCQAEILLQWATIRLKFDDKIGAARDVYEAYNLLEKNKILFPQFIENNKSLSIIHALAESIPSWVRKLAGVKGSIALGTKEISELAKVSSERNSVFKTEVIAIYSYILFYLNNEKEEAYQLFDKYGLDHKTSPLICFLKATISQKSGRNEEAIRILQERPFGKEYMEFYYLDFMYGKFKLYRLDPDANIYIKRFLNNFNGQHYVKEAFQKLAWYEWVINGDKAAYNNHMKACRDKGNKLIDEDIQAYKESTLKAYPDRILLKARMLYDGGYFKDALDLLYPMKNNYLTAIHDGEYYYRMGRIYDAISKNKEALEYYNLTITKADPDKYYACSAALHIGMIEEKQNNKKAATKAYEKCLQLNPEGYSSSLHQKAKAGLDRMRSK
ncbi:MAG: hypothetical protein IPM42_08335 [Saprospiraceae bacterium]|nr:hypothetical protein [Saprospiraceae bacterium]